MAKQSLPKVVAKRAIKGSLRRTKNVLRRSSTARKIGSVLRHTFFPENPRFIYNFSRFAPTIADYMKQREEQELFAKKPTISIVMPTYNTPADFLRECIESVQIQSYPHWELCIADDASQDKDVVTIIKGYAAQDKRIKLVERKINGHISEATNSAIEIATGEYIALLDHDDLLWPNALFEVVKAINGNPSVDFIYSDEDKIDAESDIHSYPFLKPDWSPEFLESCNYITHFSCVRAELVREVGCLRKGYEGAQDWDLFLRIGERTNKVFHIPKILYSWRLHEASTAMDTSAKPYVLKAQKDLLVDHLTRTQHKGVVKQGIIKQHSRIEYTVSGQPLVTMVMYGGEDRQLKKAADRAQQLTAYPSLEVVLAPGADNSAKICNQAVKQAKGEYLVFIDARMRIITKNWVELLIGDAQLEGVGAVGGKTLSQSRDCMMRAGVGLGIYGLYAPLLEYMPNDDIHYMRGLYGQSRRNVTAVDSGCLAVKADLFKLVGGFSEDLDDMFVVDFCLNLLKAGRRTIYNPIIETVDSHNITAGSADMKRNREAVALFQSKWAEAIKNDPYLHPYFTRTNAQLEMK